MAAGAQQSITPRTRSQFSVKTERVEMLAARLEAASDPELRATALELVRSVIELHGAALQSLVDRCLDLPHGEEVLSQALDDNLVSSIFLLHSLQPDDIRTRVLRGIESVRPYLKSHGGDCELITVDNGIVSVRLHGTCGNCPSSAQTLKNAVEDAVYEFAPDIQEVIAENTVTDRGVAEDSNSPKLVMLK